MILAHRLGTMCPEVECVARYGGEVGAKTIAIFEGMRIQLTAKGTEI
jgi:hypothetical protein